MATLTGVKLVDVKGGEIQEVEFEGDVYTRVGKDVEARIGDLLYLEDSRYIIGGEDGKFYQIEVEEDGKTLVIPTPMSGIVKAIVNDDYGFVLRKEATKLDFMLGDTVRLLKGGGEYPLHGFTNGEIYELTDRFPSHTEEGRMEIKNADGKSGYALPSQLEVVDLSELVGKYVKFKEGELDITPGKTYEIIDTRRGGGIIFKDNAGDRRLRPYPCEEYEVVDEPVSQDRSGEMLMKGDIVEIIAEGSHEYEIGEKVRIILVDENDPRLPYDTEYVDGRGATSGWVGPRHIKLVEEASKIIEAGDIVRITRYQHGAEVGEIVEVLEVNRSVKYAHHSKMSGGWFLAAKDAVEVVAKSHDRIN